MLDIVLLQETSFSVETFKNCNYIKSFFDYVFNNATNEYGAGCIIRKNFEKPNINLDVDRCIIKFDIGVITIANVYAESGTDGIAEMKRNYV